MLGLSVGLAKLKLFFRLRLSPTFCRIGVSLFMAEDFEPEPRLISSQVELSKLENQVNIVMISLGLDASHYSELCRVSYRFDIWLLLG